MPTEKLSNLLKNNNLTQAQFESIAYRFSPQQKRLFLHLFEYGETMTTILVDVCAIINIPHIVKQLNRKLIDNTDGREITCKIKSHVNKFDDKTRIGYWKIRPLLPLKKQLG